MFINYSVSWYTVKSYWRQIYIYWNYEKRGDFPAILASNIKNVSFPAFTANPVNVKTLQELPLGKSFLHFLLCPMPVSRMFLTYNEIAVAI